MSRARAEQNVNSGTHWLVMVGLGNAVPAVYGIARSDEDSLRPALWRKHMLYRRWSSTAERLPLLHGICGPASNATSSLRLSRPRLVLPLTQRRPLPLVMDGASSVFDAYEMLLSFV